MFPVIYIPYMAVSSSCRIESQLFPKICLMRTFTKKMLYLIELTKQIRIVWYVLRLCSLIIEQMRQVQSIFHCDSVNQI